jgi:hypothetical protein
MIGQSPRHTARRGHGPNVAVPIESERGTIGRQGGIVGESNDLGGPAAFGHERQSDDGKDRSAFHRGVLPFGWFMVSGGAPMQCLFHFHEIRCRVWKSGRRCDPGTMLTSSGGDRLTFWTFSKDFISAISRVILPQRYLAVQQMPFRSPRIAQRRSVPSPGGNCLTVAQRPSIEKRAAGWPATSPLEKGCGKVASESQILYLQSITTFRNASLPLATLLRDGPFVLPCNVFQQPSATRRSLILPATSFRFWHCGLRGYYPSDVVNECLAPHLWTHRNDLFTFLLQLRLNATNWQAELVIRFGVILRKVWGDNHTWVGVRVQAVLMSVWHSCWQRGHTSLDFLTQLLRCEPALVGLPL